MAERYRACIMDLFRLDAGRSSVRSPPRAFPAPAVAHRAYRSLQEPPRHGSQIRRRNMTRFHAMAFAAFGLIAFSVQASAQVGDPTRGERMYRACVACHSLEPNRNMTGPSLAEVWNRKSGSLASFPRYSPALKSAGIIWNDDTLGEWIKDPQHFIPGNTMTFPRCPARARTPSGRVSQADEGHGRLVSAPHPTAGSPGRASPS